MGELVPKVYDQLENALTERRRTDSVLSMPEVKVMTSEIGIINDTEVIH